MENISSQYMVLSFCFLNSIVQEELLIFEVNPKKKLKYYDFYFSKILFSSNSFIV